MNMIIVNKLIFAKVEKIIIQIILFYRDFCTRGVFYYKAVKPKARLAL